MEIGEICARLNERAGTLAPDLLPNGRKAGNKWMFSGIPDHGGSESAYVHLSGPKIGKWFDMGNAAPGEDKGDMLDLVRIKRCGGDQRAAIAEARRELGLTDPWVPGAQLSGEEKARRAEEARKRAEAREAREQEDRRRKAVNAKRLFLRGHRIAGTPAGRYLLGRGLAPVAGAAWPGSLRFFDQVPHGPMQAKLPAMLACIVTAEGQHIGTHRIFLQEDARLGWTKLRPPEGMKAKMVLGNLWGGFVPIHKGSSGQSMRGMAEGERIYATEGIEDGLAVAMVNPAARTICAVSLANIGAIVLPPQTGELVIVADRDENATAQDQLERSIAQQQARGVKVAIVMPPKGVKDINEWLLAERRERGAA